MICGGVSMGRGKAAGGVYRMALGMQGAGHNMALGAGLREEQAVVKEGWAL